MKDVVKFEEFSEIKKSEENNNTISENPHDTIEEFIQLLIKNTLDDKSSVKVKTA